jgi:hypothetical protein
MTVKVNSHHVKETTTSKKSHANKRTTATPQQEDNRRATHWTTPFAVPTSLSMTSNQIVCHLPVAKEKEPRASEVP